MNREPYLVVAALNSPGKPSPLLFTEFANLTSAEAQQLREAIEAKYPLRRLSYIVRQEGTTDYCSTEGVEATMELMGEMLE